MRRRSPHLKNKRRVWLALILSFLLPGLGQLYCGKFRRGLVLFLLSILNVPLILCLFYISTSPVLMPIMLASGAASTVVRLCAIIDAGLLAKRAGPHYQPRNYNRPLVYITVIVASYLLNSGIAYLIKTYTVEAFVQPSFSSYPTVLPHDRILANKTAYRKQDPQRGDMVVFIPPIDPHQFFVHRVVAVAGDTIELKDNELYINGQKLPRQLIPDSGYEKATLGLPPRQYEGQVFQEVNGNSRYRIFLTTWPFSWKLRNFDRITVPPDHCFVLGDNRNASRDSRIFGPIHLDTIIGRADYIYHPARDWSRFGRIER